MMNTTTARQFTAEFDGAYDQRVKGLGRLVQVTELPDGGVNIVVSGQNPISDNLGFVTLMDVDHTAAEWEQLRPCVTKAPGFKLVRGEEF